MNMLNKTVEVITTIEMEIEYRWNEEYYNNIQLKMSESVEEQISHMLSEGYIEGEFMQCIYDDNDDGTVHCGYWWKLKE